MWEGLPIPVRSVLAMVPAAFFDLDNTLVHGSSLAHLGRAALRAGLVTRRQLAGFACMEARFVLTRSEHAGDRLRLTERSLALVQGREEDEVRAFAAAVAPRILERRAVAATVRRLRAHQASGCETWLVTASPLELAEPLAHLLGMTGALGTRLEVVDGAYTGRLQGRVLHGAEKARAVVALARSAGIDLTGSAAYSDSINDVPLLSLVGRASVVNANRALRAEARRRDWTVLHAIDTEERLPSAVGQTIALHSDVLGSRAAFVS